MPCSLLKALWGFILENIKLIGSHWSQSFPLAAKLAGYNSVFIAVLPLTRQHQTLKPRIHILCFCAADQVKASCTFTNKLNARCCLLLS